MLATHGQWFPDDSIQALYQTKRVVYELTNREPRPTRLDRLKATVAGIEQFTLVKAPELVKWVKDGWTSFSPDQRASLLKWAQADYQQSNASREVVGVGQQIAIQWWWLANRAYVLRVVERAEYAICEIADEIFHQDEIAKRLGQAQPLFAYGGSEAQTLGADAKEPVGR